MTDDALCADCPPTGYPTEKTRCGRCPRREAMTDESEARAGAGERPANCAEPMRCGWHHVKTEPDIGFWSCINGKCGNGIKAQPATPAPAGLIERLAASLDAVMPLLRTIQEHCGRGEHDETIARAAENLRAYRAGALLAGQREGWRTVTDEMVDAVNSLDGWSGFTKDDLTLLLKTMQSAAPPLTTEAECQPVAVDTMPALIGAAQKFLDITVFEGRPHSAAAHGAMLNLETALKASKAPEGEE